MNYLPVIIDELNKLTPLTLDKLAGVNGRKHWDGKFTLDIGPL